MLPYPTWQQPLQQAIHERDMAKLPAKLEAAETAIVNRMAELDAEQDAIKNATTVLRKMQTDRLGWPKAGLDEPRS